MFTSLENNRGQKILASLNWHHFYCYIGNSAIVEYMPSSVISQMEYNATSCVLRIIFVSGMIYDYINVPEAVYLAMKGSTSKGTYLNQHIKGAYRFKKIQ